MTDDAGGERPPAENRDWLWQLISADTEPEGGAGDVSNARPSVDEWLTEQLGDEIPRLKDPASLHEPAAEDRPARPETGVSADAVKLTGEQYMTLLGQLQPERLPTHWDTDRDPAAKTVNESAATTMGQKPGRVFFLLLTVAVVYLRWRQDSRRLPGRLTRAPASRHEVWMSPRRYGSDAALSNESTEHHGR
jgi:hypothetical protein